MHTHIFSVFDSKIDAFIQPFYAQTEGEACRMFETAASDETHQFNRHAGDYTLFYFGYFCNEKGDFVILDVPKNLGLALTYVRTAGEGLSELEILDHIQNLKAQLAIKNAVKGGE